MATIRAYTTIEQSRKLAGILPIESADMYWRSLNLNGHISWSSHIKRLEPPIYDLEYYIPCWSLASLLGVLPNNKHISTTLSRGGWKIEPIEYVDNWWCEYEDEIHTKNFSTSADNPVDACYEMIIKLHELNLL